MIFDAECRLSDMRMVAPLRGIRLVRRPDGALATTSVFKLRSFPVYASTAISAFRRLRTATKARAR